MSRGIKLIYKNNINTIFPSFAEIANHRKLFLDIAFSMSSKLSAQAWVKSDKYIIHLDSFQVYIYKI